MREPGLLGPLAFLSLKFDLDICCKLWVIPCLLLLCDILMIFHVLFIYTHYYIYNHIPYIVFILDTCKQVIWQAVKNQMTCHMMQHFIRVCTVCKGKNKSSCQKCIIIQRPLKTQNGQFHTYSINKYIML